MTMIKTNLFVCRLGGGKSNNTKMSNRQNSLSYNPSPNAPDNDDDYSEQDYQIAEIDDQNDGDVIYVRWSVPHQQAYMYSVVDRPTQWVHHNWTIRKTIEIGLGPSMRAGETFLIENMTSNFVIVHRERVDDDDEAIMESLDPWNSQNGHRQRVNETLDQTWHSSAANKIMYMFNVR